MQDGTTEVGPVATVESKFPAVSGTVENSAETIHVRAGGSTPFTGHCRALMQTRFGENG